MAVIIPIVIPNAGALIAAQAAARQRTTDCTAWIPDYKHAGASIAQMKYYAGCVDWLHPTTTNSQELWMKATIFATFVGIAIGIWWMKDDRIFETGYGRSIAGAFAGALSGMAAVMTCAGVYYGALYLVGWAVRPNV